MYISRFQVGNYKSFREPIALEFTQGFNIISGQNNSGKTALLEALALFFTGSPHRSTKTVPARDTVPYQLSWADVSFALPPKELKELMLTSPSTLYTVAKPDLGSPFARKNGFIDDSIQSANRLLEAIFAEDLLTFKVRFQTPASGHSPICASLEVPSYGLYAAQGQLNSWQCMAFRVNNTGRFDVAQQGILSSSDIGLQLGTVFQKHVYRFAAERMKVGRSPHGPYPLLQADGRICHKC